VRPDVETVTMIEIVARMTGEMIVTGAEAIGEMRIDWTVVLTEIPETNTIREIEMAIVIEPGMAIVIETIGEVVANMAIVIGETTATAAEMTEGIAAATVIDGAETADAATTGRPVSKCTLTAGIALILSLVVGRIWIQGSETYQSRLERSARPELPMHMNLLLCPS